MQTPSGLQAAAVATLVVGLLAVGAVAVGPFDPVGDLTGDAPGTAEGDDDRLAPTPQVTPTPGQAHDGDEPTPTPAVHASYDQTTVAVLDADTGEEKGNVTAAIADNRSLRYTGLSETDHLPEDRGMLFTYGSERDLTFVMRNMSFAIDIVFVDGNGTVTEIHHAPEPGPDEDGSEQRYPGYGQYVLEVNYGWTTDRGVEVGDRVAFELP